MAVGLAGCVSDQSARADPAKIELTTAVNSPQRMRECAADYNAATKEFADCWAGKRYTNSEFCLYAGRSLANGFLSDWQKAAIYEKMRNRRCMN